MITPPNFGYVEDGIYRCGSPDPRSYGFLESLNLRTCILLTDSHDEAFVRFLKECGVNVLCPLNPAPAAEQYPQQQQHQFYADDFGGGGMSGAFRSNMTAATAGPNERGNPLQQQQQQQQQPRQGGAIWKKPPLAPSGSGAAAAEEGSAERGGSVEAGAVVGAEAQSDSHGGTLSAQELSVGSATPPMSPAIAEEGVPRDSNLSRYLSKNNQQHHNPASLRMNPSAGGFSDGVTVIPSGYSDDAPPYLNAATATLRGEGASAITGRFNFNSDHGVGGNGARLRGLMTLPETVVVSILHVLLDPQYYPVLITCPMGRYRTGIVCGCLRKLQRWNLVSILEEYRRFAGDKSRADNEDFIELFDKDLVCLELEGGRRPRILYY